MSDVLSPQPYVTVFAAARWGKAIRRLLGFDQDHLGEDAVASEFPLGHRAGIRPGVLLQFRIHLQDRARHGGAIATGLPYVVGHGLFDRAVPLILLVAPHLGNLGGGAAKLLIEAELVELTGEYLVLKHLDQFSAKAVDRARERLGELAPTA